MSYRNQYSGSPWQQGGPPFGVGSYNQNYGNYNDQFSHQMMNSGYNRNQGGYGGGMYGSGGMGQMRNMGYGGPTQSRHYMNDRMGGRSLPRGQMQRKRLPQRSPASGPRSKRPNIESDRRMVKPRRQRDSRGSSKGRSHERSDEEEEDDTYNPEEPTDDLSDVESDAFEAWKSSDEDGEKKANGEQVVDSADAEKEKSDDATAKKTLICYVCKVTCSTRDRLTKHQKSKSHTAKIDELLAIRRFKKKDVVSDEGKKDKGSDQDKKKLRKPGNWCTVCECAFNGNFLTHRRTKEHRKKRDKKYPKCRPCRLGFSSSEEYRDHYKSEEHKQKSAEFHYLKNLASGSDDDEEAIKPVHVEEDPEEAKMEDETVEETAAEEATSESQEATDETKDDAEGKEKKADSEKQEVKKPKPKEPKAVGQSFVISVQGYYCKLCHKFFKDITVAKSKHCRSIMHTDAFKKAMEDAIEQEEDRQKLAEEQDKVDKEAQDAAELAAEIASIERAAKEAAKKEAAAKKGETPKEEDIEMKDVSVAGTKTDNAPETEEDKMDEEKIENGVKVEVPDPVTATEEDTKKEEKIEEEVEEEPEEAKEEVATTTKRGRGRGRGRKRR